MRIFLACIPPRTTHHAKRIVRVGRFARLADRPELVAARETLDALLLPHQPGTPVPGPYRVTLSFCWPWLASHAKRFRLAGVSPMTSKPDCDNLAKGITDRLAALRFIEDDRQIVDLHVSKWWGDAPGIVVQVETWRPVA